MSSVSYTVETTTGLIIGDNLNDPSTWETIPAWTVVREANRFGSHVAKYADEETARRIADTLQGAAASEVD